MKIIAESGYDFTKLSRQGREETYPFSTMKIGESFKVPSGVKLSSMKVYCSQRGRLFDKKFRVRSTEDGEYRVFRIS